MYQKDLVRAAWKAAGLYDEDDAKLRQFLALLDDPAQCWPELIQACRRDFAAYKARLAQPILDSDDTLIHLQVIRAAAEADELDLLERYIGASDPARAEAEFKAIALKGVPRLNSALVGRPGLPQTVRALIPAPRAKAAPEATPAHPGELACRRKPGRPAPPARRPPGRCRTRRTGRSGPRGGARPRPCADCKQQSATKR
jgi:hypothetical protein